MELETDSESKQHKIKSKGVGTVANDVDENESVLGNDAEGDEYVESVENSIDRMRDEGGIAPELPHSKDRAHEVQRHLSEGTLHS
ncbi:hypothetical protein JZ785_17260 [Alicyclobacillus curvatus]|nr:hypothetical protein JZ785_17260 [Alicyclobacillus curvatus]